MNMAKFPVVFQQMDACGVKNGRRVSTSVVPSLAVLLVARGSDRLIIPAPHAIDRERAEAGIARLPPERRAFVSLCDTHGNTLARVRDYLEPLRRKARKWPEDAFVAFAEDFLYEVLIATSQRAGIISDSASTLREFVPLVDPSCFSGEARFRLVEIYRTLCCYEPGVVDHGQFIVDARKDNGEGAWDILNMAEFRAVVVASGRIGYLRHPLLGLRRVCDKLRRLMRTPTVKPLLKLATTAVDAAGTWGLAGAAGEVLGTVVEDGSKEFHPLFIPLGPVELPLFRAALSEGLPDALPPSGKIMLFEQTRGGKCARMWLNAGEEEKLEREAKQGICERLADWHKARNVLADFI